MKKGIYYLFFFVSLLFPASATAGTARLVHGAVLTDYTSIQTAITNGASGDEVHVTSGTYSGGLTMKAGVNLLGGYNPSTWNRDIAANETIIDGGGTGNAVIAANAAIDGFTIKGGGSTGWLAGISVTACSPTITNNKITANGKHGLYVEGASSPAIQNNVFSNNSSFGIYCYSFGNGGTPVIYNNTMDGNRRGISLYAFSPRIRNNIITNSREYGIYSAFSSNPDSDYNDVWSSILDNYYGTSIAAHDKSVDPVYFGAGDYSLQTAPSFSPCIDAGINVGLPYNNLPDMGAFESSASQPNPWPPEGLMGTPLSAAVKLSWTANMEPNIAGYKVSYGNVSGNYTNTVDVGNITSYDVRSLINEATYFFAVRAYNSLDNTSGYSTEISATPTAGTHELPHYSWDGSQDGSCTACHYRNTGVGELLPAGFDYRYSTELCLSCHNYTGKARGKLIDAAKSHPVFVNVTAGGNNLPVFGDLTGRFSNRMGDHLKDGNTIVCNTCHNSMEKTEDPGRTWEFTSFTGEDAWETYALQKGGWYWYDYLKPTVYTTKTLSTAPTYIKDRGQYLFSQTAYDYEPNAGTIIFNSPFFDYAYATLSYPYLRVNNSDNVMCLDCHNIGTHQLANCLTCHEEHNYSNLHGVRPRIKTPASGIKNVTFTSRTGHDSFADGDSTRNGVCEVCHTNTKYYKNDGTGFVNHSGGFNYNGKDCTACHAHLGGFSK